jgi:hypothetical protein
MIRPGCYPELTHLQHRHEQLERALCGRQPGVAKQPAWARPKVAVHADLIRVRGDCRQRVLVCPAAASRGQPGASHPVLHLLPPLRLLAGLPLLRLLLSAPVRFPSMLLLELPPPLRLPHRLLLIGAQAAKSFPVQHLSRPSPSRSRTQGAKS